MMLRSSQRILNAHMRRGRTIRQLKVFPSVSTMGHYSTAINPSSSHMSSLREGQHILKQYVERLPSNWRDANQLMGSIFYIQKGFGKYYRKPSSDGKESQGAEGASAENGAESGNSSGSTEKSSAGSNNSKNNSSKSKNRKSGGGTGGGGNKNTDEGMVMRMLLAAGIGTAAFAMVEDMKPGKEISWQDFVNQLLETGQVDRIIVSNKNIARVVLRQNLEKSSSNDSEGFGANGSNSDANNYSFGGPSDNRADDRQTGYNDRGQAAGAAGGWNSTPMAGEDAGNRNKFSRYPTIGHPTADTRTNAQYYFNIGTVESFERKLEEAQKALGIAPRDFIPVVYVSETSWTQELVRFLPTLLLIGAMMYMMRGAASSVGGGGGPGGIFKIGKSTAKRVNKESVTTSFADVAGCDEAKREILEFVEFLKDPKKFTDLGAKIPKGALLCGPPGTGKTLLAKATAGEANVPFFSISGSDFVEMFVGVGPSRVRDLFKEARENAPCILFIDEIDAVGRQRGRGGFSGGNDERENTLNQLLVEMDGFDASTNVVVLAGTNRVDILDQALTRPGRFDRQITVDRPDIQGRKAIFEVYLKNLALDGDVEQYSGRLAALTPGFVGADVANICNEAAIQAARKNKTKVDFECFEAATDRVIGGLESRKIMTPHEKRVVAYHEAGHAVAGWNLEHADPLLKVTIVPRSSGALGYAQYLPKELFLRTQEQIMDTVCMALAGRASEQVNFGNVTTGAADDLRRVTQIVYQMVQVYGMNKRVGQVAFPRDDSGGFPQDKMYSNATAEVMDEEVRTIVDAAYTRTIELMEERKEQVRLVAEMLLEKETITNIDVANLIGKRPFSSGKEYDEYISIGWDSGKTAKDLANEDASAAQQGSNDEDNSSASGGVTLSPA